MKNLITIGCFLFIFFLTGCFEDEGNYDLKETNEPTWLWNYTQSPLYITTYAGDTINVNVPFRFDKDSATALANARYEWRFNGTLFSEDRNLRMPADTIVKKLNLPFSETSGGSGTYAIIDKTTDIKYMVRTWLTIRPMYYKGDWLILSENGADSKLSFYKIKRRTVGGMSTTTYTLYDNVYEELNPGMKLPGTPRRLRYHVAKHISAPMGATTIVTSQSGYTLNNENLLAVGDVKEEFEDGIPANFNISNVFHGGQVSWIATEDGRLFRRIMSDNWLGGKYLADPYVVDEKGYKVTDFGHGRTPSNITSPCYDELNRRVLMIRMRAPFSILPVTYIAGTNHPLPVWDMPAGTEVLHLYASSHKNLPYGDNQMYSMIFNDANGDTWMADFVLNKNNGLCVEHEHASLIRFPGGNLPKGTKFLTAAADYKPYSNIYTFYTKGNELRYVNRVNDVDYPFMTFDHEITVVRYNAYNINYNRLGIGLENGDFFLVDLTDIANPVIMEETKVNVGGKVVDLMEFATDTYVDLY